MLPFYELLSHALQRHHHHIRVVFNYVEMTIYHGLVLIIR